MKLKRHREDVRDLKLMQDAHVQAIAKRYQRLILAFEQATDNHMKTVSLEYLKEHFNIHARRVLKDAEE